MTTFLVAVVGALIGTAIGQGISYLIRRARR